MAKARQIPGLTADMTYSQAAAATVAVRADEVFEHGEGVLDVTQIEKVHAMRVATRRLRAVLEFYEPCFPRKQLRPVLQDVKDLADALGGRRDPDVELLALEQFSASVGPGERSGVEFFIERTRAQQTQANDDLIVALAQIQEHGLREKLAALAGTAHEPVLQSVGEDDPADEPEELDEAEEVLAHGDGHAHQRIGEDGRPAGPVPGSAW